MKRPTSSDHRQVQPKFTAKSKRMVSVDMDGTIADVTKRKEYALQFGPDRSVNFFSVFLDGAHYGMDSPIIASRDMLGWYRDVIKGDIVYLSGRRQGSEHQSEAWLRTHGFPLGQIIHRKKGERSLDFKASWIRWFRQSCWVDAHFGDRLDDDGDAARHSGVKFVYIQDHVWPPLSEMQTLFSLPPNP